jgi:hypothetical protein
MLILLVLGCPAQDDCAAMCDAAEGRYESCMAERGLAWGDAYEDEQDYRNWCDTWAWEARQLGEADRCAAMLPAMEEGTCEDYDAAWSLE